MTKFRLPVDPEICRVAKYIRSLDNDGTRIANVLRNTIDQLYDGQRTGRYRWDQLYKTEKTHCGTLVEINLQREFQFEDGRELDYSIKGIEVDCKYSQRVNGWMIPPEALDKICMLVWAEDSADPKWSLGLVRVTKEKLNTGGNRDSKASLNENGRDAIEWLWKDFPMPANALLRVDPSVVEHLMSIRSGAARVRQLFRVTQRMAVGRSVVATVAQQKDYMKRVRANGGARSTLRLEGILVLGQYRSHARIAVALGLARPGSGDTISVRVSPATAFDHAAVEIDGSLWRVAVDSDPVVQAPVLPKPTRSEIAQEDAD